MASGACLSDQQPARMLTGPSGREHEASPEDSVLSGACSTCPLRVGDGILVGGQPHATDVRPQRPRPHGALRPACLGQPWLPRLTRVPLTHQPGSHSTDARTKAHKLLCQDSVQPGPAR